MGFIRGGAHQPLGGSTIIFKKFRCAVARAPKVYSALGLTSTTVPGVAHAPLPPCPPPSVYALGFHVIKIASCRFPALGEIFFLPHRRSPSVFRVCTTIILHAIFMQSSFLCTRVPVPYRQLHQIHCTGTTVAMSRTGLL